MYLFIYLFFFITVFFFFFFFENFCHRNVSSIGYSCDKTNVIKLSSIIKTYLYYFDPLKPHFYIVKMGFTRVYIIFLISAQKHRLWVLVRTASLRRF